MPTCLRRFAFLLALSLTLGAGILPAQQRPPLTTEQIDQVRGRPRG